MRIGDLVTPSKWAIYWEVCFDGEPSYGSFRIKQQGLPYLTGGVLADENFTPNQTWEAGEVFGLLVDESDDYFRVKVVGGSEDIRIGCERATEVLEAVKRSPLSS